jgi:nucleoside-diphosphate-sugar epimerase
MRVVIIGGAGMIGRKLAERLARDGALGETPIDALELVDMAEPAVPPGARFTVQRAITDLAKPGAAATILERRPEVVFHLAAVVSGEAESDFEKGYRINLDGTRDLLEAARALAPAYCPRFVFTSSIAVFGGPYPEIIDDDFAPRPLTSYGTQKAMCELLLDDYSRRGFVDGVGLRLPTICVRPGTANLAASGFFSNIVREPLNGREAILPVPDEIRHWFASPRAAVGFLVHAATLPVGALGSRRTLTMPGLSASVAEQIEALRRVGGEAAVRRIRREPDAGIARIVSGWPSSFTAARARALGFAAEADFDEIVRVHVEDELGGRVPQAAA